MNPPETAPRDCIILADFGWPWILPARWNPIDGNWATVTLQCGPVNGQWEDCYFESEREADSDLRGWLPMPVVTRR